ncbi:hypothetical protein [Streptomyces fructofermentans]|uniref:Uncharacterized protein n=1 Tax=Streptomyces fructofermentans TaxID=152141 RepID=A0A918U5S7_9ACTN|nr:hypothetical protein [Streptomyces fructofermentans]GGX97510.1 hypothetical protein GCM10010515_74930 [Streptomyces fructofermentans]
MSKPFPGDGAEHPYRADGIAGLSASTIFGTLRTIRQELEQGRDADQPLPQDEELRHVRDLESLDDPCPPWNGLAAQAHFWDTLEASLMPRIAGEVQAALERVTNTAGVPITVIGAKGSLDERTAEFREHVLSGRPVVSISATGCLRRLFATGDAASASLSVLVWLPNHPLHAAAVTVESALMSDCTNAHRLLPCGTWIQMLGEPLVPDPEPGCIVLPRSLSGLETGLRREYQHLLFVDDTSSAIIQAVLNRAVPAAVHFSEGVLNSAIVLVSAGHGMAVRLYGSGGSATKPWDASKILYKAATGGTPFVEGLVIARDEITARRLGRIVDDEIDHVEQLGFPDERDDDQ